MIEDDSLFTTQALIDVRTISTLFFVDFLDTLEPQGKCSRSHPRGTLHNIGSREEGQGTQLIRKH